MKRDPTPLNERYNKMPKYRGFKPGMRKMGEEDAHHGTVKVVYSRDYAALAGTYYCSQCRGGFDAPKRDKCPWCHADFEPPH
jgi:hypothetical protein